MGVQLTGRIVVPGSPDYDAARQEFNLRVNRCPLVIVFCRATQDVVNAVCWARENGVPIRARSGRHSYEGFSSVDGGIVIDLSEMQEVVIDSAKGIALIQPGCRLLPLYERLWQNGVTVPGGTCPTVGIGGLVQGGGFGLLSRAAGLLCDHLQAVEMVDAGGCTLQADETVNNDLFWALRGGGGGNFGLCTGFLFRLTPVGNVGYCDMTWHLSRLEQVVNAWQDWAPYVDPRLTMTLQAGAGRAGSIGPTIRSTGQFLGTEADLRHLVQPLVTAAPPDQLTVTELPYIQSVQQVAATDPFTPLKFKNTGNYVYRRLPPAALATIRCFLEEAPSEHCGIWCQSLAGAVTCVKPGDTAYYHRKALWVIEITANWTDDAAAPAHICWAEQFRKALLPFTFGTYVNWPDLSIADWPSQYYGSNFKRLRQVKRKYDPRNIFRYAQSIPPAIWPPEAAGCE